MFDDEPDDELELSEDTVKDLDNPSQDSEDVRGGMAVRPKGDDCPSGGNTTQTDSCKIAASKPCE